MQRYVVVPRQGELYRRPHENTTEVYTLRERQSQELVQLAITVRFVIDNWSPNGDIRVEGYIRAEDGTTRGVIGHYVLDDASPDLGILEVQDT